MGRSTRPRVGGKRFLVYAFPGICVSTKADYLSSFVDFQKNGDIWRHDRSCRQKPAELHARKPKGSHFPSEYGELYAQEIKHQRLQGSMQIHRQAVEFLVLGFENQGRRDQE